MMNYTRTNKLEVSEPGSHYFGGDWTQDKLSRLRKYLAAYAKIMQNQHFNYAYIDAFAGTGYISKPTSEETENSLFLELGGEEPQSFLAGSVKTALEIKPEFNKYIFIDKNSDHCHELDLTCSEYPELLPRIKIVNAEANETLQELCNNRNWRNHRAVLFLDPYGMQVTWETLESIAAQKLSICGCCSLWECQ